jgi:hypothetical protein
MPHTKSVLLSDDTYKMLKKRASGKHGGDSDFMRTAIESFILIDKKLLNVAGRLAAAIGCHPITVISNFAISKLAQRDAEIEVFGVTDRIYNEIRKVDGVVVEGEQLYQALKEQYVHELMRKKEYQQEFADQIEQAIDAEIKLD